MAAVASGAATSASTSTLWATASKEWVIQPKPKPGRKPKKDTVTTAKDEEEVDTKGRRIQNRAAQRAFRERKQSQLAELQARVQSYEQGEIERNVALQNIAKRLKEENELLRRENIILKEKFSKLEADKLSHEGDKKRWRDDSPASTSSSHAPAKKKTRANATGSPNSKLLALTTSFTSSPGPPSMVSSPDSNGSSDTRFSPVPYSAQSEHAPTSIPNILDFTTNFKGSTDHSHSFPTFDCGFCSEDTPCVCREIAMQQAADRAALTGFKSEILAQHDVPMHLNRRVEIVLENQPSILENLPAYQSPVPLRRRTGAPPVNAIFPIHIPPAPQPSQSQQSAIATCSGDPSNCLACADDPFGKAFCAAIEDSVGGVCNDCPSRQVDGTFKYSNSSSTCCGNQGNCGQCSSSSQTMSSTSETIPTNDAWRQLKAHPNVSFSDLALLADVVASRFKCSGPKIDVPSSSSQPTTNSNADTPQSDHESILLTDPHAHYHEKERAQLLGNTPPPHLLSQDMSLKCGRQRVKHVDADAVRDALRLLDSKFS